MMKLFVLRGAFLWWLGVLVNTPFVWFIILMEIRCDYIPLPYIVLSPGTHSSSPVFPFFRNNRWISRSVAPLSDTVLSRVAQFRTYFWAYTQFLPYKLLILWIIGRARPSWIFKGFCEYEQSGSESDCSLGLSRIPSILTSCFVNN